MLTVVTGSARGRGLVRFRANHGAERSLEEANGNALRLHDAAPLRF